MPLEYTDFGVFEKYRLEFRRSMDRSWMTESKYSDVDETEFLADMQSRYPRIYRYRDYALRLIECESGHVMWQEPANDQYIHRFPAELQEFVAWNWPGGNTVTLTGVIRHMINVNVRRVGGKMMLLVNAKDFHDELDKIGVAHSETEYLDRPAASTSVADTSFRMSTDVLLKRDYKEVEVVDVKMVDGKPVKETKKIPVTCAADLTRVFSVPPTFEQLKKLSNSAQEAARRILDHYVPIDICVEIQKKLIK
jgi:hypothetical protein